MTPGRRRDIAVEAARPREAAALAPLVRAEVLHAQLLAGYYEISDGFDWVAYTRAMIDGRERAVLAARPAERPQGFIALRVRRLGSGPHRERWWLQRHRRSDGHLPLAPLVLGTIDSCYVEEACRHRGVGRALAEAALRWFDDAGVKRIELGALVAGEAVAFWEHCGFRPYRLLMSLERDDAGPPPGVPTEAPGRSFP